MRYLLDRLFITITILYCIVLIALNFQGFFDYPSQRDISRFISPYARDVTGKVTHISEENISKQIFILKVRELEGYPCSGMMLVNSFSKVARVEEGDIVRLRCVPTRPPAAKNPGSFDYAAYLKRMNIHCIAYISFFDKIGHEPLPFYLRLARSAHQDMIDTLQKYLPPAESAVLIPMLIGDKQSLSNEEKRAFTDAGVMHTLVVSGFNVAYVAGIFILLFRIIGLKRRLASLLTMPFLILYLLVTGYSPPALRATVMAFSIILSMSLDRDSLIYQSLALSAAVILIFDPQALFNASFQLSFAATIGIVYLYPFMMKPFENFPRWIRDSLFATTAVSLSAQFAVMPILAYYFNRISLAGLVSNIPIVPLTGIVTGAGILLYLAHFVSAWLTSLIALFTSLLMKIILTLVHYFAGLPGATTHVATPKLWAIFLYYFFLCAIVQFRKIKYMPFILGGSATLLLAIYISLHSSTQKTLEITALYAGIGSAVDIAFPDNSHWLIDCGRQKDGRRAICPYLWSKGIRKIGKIIITSDEKRYCGGLQDISDNFPVSDIVYPFPTAKQEQYFVSGSTVTLSTTSAAHLAVMIDYEGKRFIYTDQDEIPAEAPGNYKSVLHLKCHRRQNDGFLLNIGRLNPSAVILSGTPPKDMPAMKNFYILRECGAVSVAINSKGMRIKRFLEGNSTDEDNEQ